jgi:5'-deoxynucleotidase YfbR-like HD superfamily hydrolase
VHVSKLVESYGRECALWGLLHDAAEAYTGDLTRPLKAALRALTPVFDAMDREVEWVVQTKFALWPIDADYDHVHYADMQMVVAEAKQFMAPLQEDWLKSIGNVKVKPIGWKLRYWSPRFAEEQYLRRFEQLHAK